MRQIPSYAFRRMCLGLALLATTWSFPQRARADAYALQQVKTIADVLKPNVLVVLETAESMQDLPGEDAARYNEVGMDCEDGNRQCRLVGQAGRWTFSGMGSKGISFGGGTGQCTSTVTTTSTITQTNTLTSTGTSTNTGTTTGLGTGTQTTSDTTTNTGTATNTRSQSTTRTDTDTRTASTTETRTGSESNTTTGTVTETTTNTGTGTATTTASATQTATNSTTATSTNTVTNTRTNTNTTTNTGSGTGSTAVTGTSTSTGTTTVTLSDTVTKTSSSTGTGTTTTTRTTTATVTTSNTVTSTRTETSTVTNTGGLTCTGSEVSEPWWAGTNWSCTAGQNNNNQNWNLWSNGYCEKGTASGSWFYADAGTQKLTVNAHSTPYQGTYAHMYVTVNGTNVGNVWTTGSVQTYTFNYTLAVAGNITVRIYFDNDGSGGTEDRNLYIGTVTNYRGCTSGTSTGTSTKTATYTTTNATATQTAVRTSTNTQLSTETRILTATATGTATRVCGGTSVFYEAENLAFGGSPAVTANADAGASNGKYLMFSTTPTSAGSYFIDVTLPSLAAGTYAVSYAYKAFISRGIVQARIDGVNIGGAVDQYDANQVYGRVANLGSVTLAAGNHTMRFATTSKNASASGYQIIVDTITLAATSGSCTGTGTSTVTATGIGTGATTTTTTRTDTTTVTSTGTGTATATGTSTATVTKTDTATTTTTSTNTSTITRTVTGTVTGTQTNTITGTATLTESNTLTNTGTTTTTATVTNTGTGTGTGTLTNTQTSTSTGTMTMTGTINYTVTDTNTDTDTSTVTYPCGSMGTTDTAPCTDAVPTTKGYCSIATDTQCWTNEYCANATNGDYCRFIATPTDGSGRPRNESCISSTATFMGSCKHGVVTKNTPCGAPSETTCGNALAGDYCAQGLPATMCSDSGLWCSTGNADCPAGAGTCAGATSRMMTVKRALRRAITDHADKVSFGFMNTYQGRGIPATATDASTAIFPYVKLTSCPSTPNVTETKLLTRGELEAAGCFSLTTGPATSCKIDYGGNGALNGTASFNQIDYGIDEIYAGENSRWLIPRGDGTGRYTPIVASWSSCSSSPVLPACQFVGQGTGIYEGSYYKFTYKQGTPIPNGGVDGEGSRAHPIYFTTYRGKYYTDGINCYNALDAERSDFVNDGIYGRPAYTGTPYNHANEVPSAWAGSADSTTCSGTTGAVWNSLAVPFLNQTGTSTSTFTFNGKSITRAQKTLMTTARLEKASFGGVAAAGSVTPVACSLDSANAYLSTVKNNDLAANGNKAPCWTNNIVLVVDGQGNGPGDTGRDASNNTIACASTQCAYHKDTNPTLDGCNCPAIMKAYNLARGGVQTHVVVNAPATWSTRYPYTYAFLWNLAVAGSPMFDGTPSFGTTEEEVYRGISNKIAEAAYHFPYTTTVPVAGATTQNPETQLLTPSPYLFDTSVSYPGWIGTLRAFDTGSNAALLWDAATVAKNGHPATWKDRRIYFANKTGGISRVGINSSTGAIINASALYNAGLGASTEEAEHIMQWLLGKPSLGNPAPLMGSVTGSAPIAVAQAAANGLNGSSAYSQSTYRRPQLVYVGGDDGMLHAFFGHAGAKVMNGVSYQGGEEAFAFIPNDMLAVIAKQYAQGKQNLAVDKSQHIFGLAGSPKVKDMCIGSGCETSTGSDWHTVLVMTEGHGGNKPFAIDITGVISETGGLDPGAMGLLWSAASSSAPAAWGNALGETTSLPGFYFAGYATGAADNRAIFASGYPTVARAGATASQGLMLLNVNAATGAIVESKDISSLGSTTCSQTRAVLSDVALARDYASAATSQSLLGAYVTDTWGNAYQYVPAASSPLGKLYALGCGQPLHFAPAVVQLDRAPQADSSSKHYVYLAQVTNSALDPVTRPYSTTYPGSQLVITKLDANISPPTLVTAYNTANGNGQVVLSTDSATASNRICVQTANDTSFTNNVKEAGQTCADAGGELLPTTARPVSTPMAVLRADGLGFQIITSWYDAAALNNDCSSGNQFNYGTSYITVHEFGADGTWYQVAGIRLIDTVLTGVTFVGTGLFVDGIMGANGGAPQGISVGESFTSMQQILNNSALERYSRTSWSERVE